MVTLNPLQLQLIRYAVVGVMSNLLCYLAYLGLAALGMDPKLAMSVLYCVAVLQTFVVNRNWTFKHRGSRRAVFFRYSAAYALGYVLNLSVLYILVDLHAYPHQVIQGMMILIIAAMLFLAQKYWVFRIA